MGQDYTVIQKGSQDFDREVGFGSKDWDRETLICGSIA